MTLRSTAVVPTDVPARYAKQLLAHLGRKVCVEPLDGVADGGRLVFGRGIGTVRPDQDALVLAAEAGSPEDLAQVEDVLARHLERFGAKRGFTVTWTPSDRATDGS